MLKGPRNKNPLSAMPKNLTPICDDFLIRLGRRRGRPRRYIDQVRFQVLWYPNLSTQEVAVLVLGQKWRKGIVHSDDLVGKIIINAYNPEVAGILLLYAYHTLCRELAIDA